MGGDVRAAGLAGAVALLLGSPWVAVLSAAAITAIIDVTGRFLAKHRLPAFFRQVVGGFLATAATAALYLLGVLPEGTQPELVVAAGITVLLSGFAVVGAGQDAIGGYHVTAAGRAAEIGVLSAGLLSGVVLGLKVAQRAGVTLDVAAELPASGARMAVTVVAAALASGFYALNGYSPLLALLFAGLAGAAGLGTYVLVSVGRSGTGGGRRSGRDGRRPGRRAAAPEGARAVGQGAAAGGRAGRDHPAAAGADGLPRLLPAVGRGRRRRPGHRDLGAWRSGWRSPRGSRSGSSSPVPRRPRSRRRIRRRAASGTRLRDLQGGRS